MNIWLLILILSLCTLASRTLPLFFKIQDKPGSKSRIVLEILPYTLMSALVFPQAFSAVEGHVIASCAAAAAAVLFAARKMPLMVSVLGAAAVCAAALLAGF